MTSSWAIRSPARDPVDLGGIGVEQQDPQLAAVAGVDQAGAVDEGDPVLARQSRARQDEARVAVGDLHRHPGADTPALARAEVRGVCRVEVHGGVALVGAGGDRGVLAQALEAQLHRA